MNEISIIIPVKNKERWRVQTCIDYINKNGEGLVKEIIVVDYNSDKPLKLKKCTVLRIDNQRIFNKTHALNLGIAKTNSEFIMTVDADILLSNKHFEEISNALDNGSFICDTNVRRILPGKIKGKTYNQLIAMSKSWSVPNRTQYINQAHGGFQLYSRKFYNKIGGLMESMGKYIGGMDSYMWLIARLNRLTIVDISHPLLHVEHEKQKNESFNLSPEELELANTYRQYKSHYLDFMVKTNIKKNPEGIGKEKPAEDLFKKFLEEYNNKDSLIREAFDRGEKSIDLLGQTFKLEKEKPAVMISVICNNDTMPTYFIWDLFHLYIHTKRFYPDVDIQQANACDVNLMRNMSALYSLGGNDLNKPYKYLIMLDDDHKYPEDFIVRFVKKAEETGWPIITGLTSSKKEPHYNTQYYKLQKDLNNPENTVHCKKKKEKFIDIECSGPVGMLIKSDIFNKLKFPWYLQTYDTPEEGQPSKFNTVGGDVNFCYKLKEAGIPIKLDLQTSFPHGTVRYLNRKF